jgi:hypothetical protein
MALDEAARQLKSATHDAQVAFDCLGLGDLLRPDESTVGVGGEGQERESQR